MELTEHANRPGVSLPGALSPTVEVDILPRRQGTAASLAPIFQQVAQKHLELAVMPVLIERIRQVFMMSSGLFPDGSQTENFLYMLELIDAAICKKHIQVLMAAKKWTVLAGKKLDR